MASIVSARFETYPPHNTPSDRFVIIDFSDGRESMADIASEEPGEIEAALTSWVSKGNEIGIAMPVPTLNDYRRAIQSHVDATAGQKGYDTGASCASYVGSTNEAWSEEALAFIAWRDAVWVYAYAELSKVQTGEREQPTVAEIVAELPAMIWPT